MKIRAICTDIDGTLLDSQRQLSARTIATFKNLHKDVKIILASSRMPAAMRHLQIELGIPDHPLIAYNGGYVIHYENDKHKPSVFESVTIDPGICSSIYSFSKGTDIHVSVYFEDEWYAPRLDQWTDREQRITKVNAQIADIEVVLNDWRQNKKGAHKVMCMGPAEQISAMAAELHKHHGNDIHIYFSRPTYLELAPRSISKASGLKRILESLYTIQPSEVMAFGDNYNDIDLLQSVGLGIAVANARDEAKAVAKEVTLKSTDDGVALAIEKYLMRNSIL
jgi:Cof subfamily protein (haloacid dehalogenase superfamily)